MKTPSFLASTSTSRARLPPQVTNSRGSKTFAVSIGTQDGTELVASVNNMLAPPHLDTPRLMLRMFCESDWDAVYEIFQDEECVRYTIGSTLNRWQSWRTLAGYLGHWSLRGYGPYAATLKATGKTSGPVGM